MKPHIRRIAVQIPYSKRHLWAWKCVGATRQCPGRSTGGAYYGIGVTPEGAFKDYQNDLLRRSVA